MVILVTKSQVERLFRQRQIERMPQPGKEGIELPTGAKVYRFAEITNNGEYAIEGYHHSGADISPYVEL